MSVDKISKRLDSCGLNASEMKSIATRSSHAQAELRVLKDLAVSAIWRERDGAVY
jgi:hypothetical protein